MGLARRSAVAGRRLKRYGKFGSLRGKSAPMMVRRGAVVARAGGMGMLRMAGYAGLAAAAGYGGYRAAKRIKRARVRRIARRKVGVKRTFPSKHRLILDSQAQTVTTDVWSAINVCRLERGTADTERENDYANIAGWRVWLHLANADQNPKDFRLIFASPKNWDVNNVPGDTELQNEFLTDYGDISSSDWNPNTKTHQQLMMHSVNRDRWNVLYDKRWTLDALNLNRVNPMKNMIDVKFWVPLKRMFKYVEGGEVPSTETTSPPVFCIYYAITKGKASGGQIENYRRAVKIVTFFREGES